MPEEKVREFSTTHRLVGEQVDRFAALEEFYGLPPGKSEVAIGDRALSLFEWVTNLRRQGTEIYIKNEEGDLVPVDFDKFDIGA